MSDAAAPLSCPGCAQPMRAQQEAGVTYDRCACGMVWFDVHELDAWAAHRLPPPHRRLESRVGVARRAPERDCPRCGVRSLEARAIGTWPVHQCQRCRGIAVAQSVLPRQQSALGDLLGSGLAEFLFALLSAL